MSIAVNESAATSQAARAPAASPALSIASRRYLIAGLGACLPLLVGYWADRNTFFDEPMRVATMLSVLFSTLGFFVAGVASAWLYPDETNRLKLLQLGMAAPAMFTAMIAGQPKESGRGALATQDHPVAAEAVSMLALVTPAYAAEPAQQQVYSFADKPQEGLGHAILRGITRGAPRYGNTFVYLNERFPTAAAAHARAAGLGVPSRVYGPGGPLPGFVVVFGDWLTPADAGEVVTAVERRGMHADLWTKPGG
jgi:hypothetical protein